MEVLSFVTVVILVAVSDALASGPLFFANLSQGAKSGAKSGLMFSVGHTLVEFSLVMLLALGLLSVTKELMVKLVIGVVGGAVLIAFGAAQIHSSLKPKPVQPQQGKAASRSLILMGLAFTGLNPFSFSGGSQQGPNLSSCLWNSHHLPESCSCTLAMYGWTIPGL